ncbi:MAG: hypothetical protein ACYDDH_12035 [Candidatus Desulforudaceae bacterium]
MLRRVKTRISSLLLVLVAMAVMVTSASAEGTATAVTTEFTTFAAELVPALIAIAGVGIGILTVFLAFRYGKAIFKSVAK